MIVAIVTRCPSCGKKSEIPVRPEQLAAWLRPGGPLVQDAFPELSADDRELLISGLCPPCWDKAVGDQMTELLAR